MGQLHRRVMVALVSSMLASMVASMVASCASDDFSSGMEDWNLDIDSFTIPTTLAPPPPTASWYTERVDPAEWWPGGVLVYSATSGIWSATPSDGSKHFVTDVYSGRADSVSPDGAWIAYTSNIDPRETSDTTVPAGVPTTVGGATASAVYVVRTDGTAKRRITDPPRPDVAISGDRHAAWSPDGEWIAFVRHGPGADPGIFVVHPDGSGLRLVRSGYVDQPLSWSPDSTQLLTTLTGADGWTVSVIDVTTGVTTALPLRGWQPAWSADGDRVAYLTSDGANTTLEVWSFTRGPLGAIYTAPDTSGDAPNSPTWSPDGEWVAFETGRYGILVAKPRTGEMHRVAYLGTTADVPVWGPEPGFQRGP